MGMLEKTSIEYQMKKIDCKYKYIKSEIFLENFLGKINAYIVRLLYVYMQLYTLASLYLHYSFRKCFLRISPSNSGNNAGSVSASQPVK